MKSYDQLISVNRRGSLPLYAQIYGAFRRRILRGELRAGEIVPSTRDLARGLRISRLPVLNAYAQLHAEGFFETRVGRGTFIAAALRARTPVATTHGGDRGISTHAAALPAYARPSWAAKLGAFQVGQPDLASFPIDLWSRLAGRHARETRVGELQYGDPMGLPELRELVAHYLRTSRGVRCESTQVMIVSGSQQGLDLATRVLLDQDDAAWVEEPGYWLVHHVLKGAGCRAVPVPVDAQGLDIAAGIRSAKPRAIFVAPSHQYPLGVTMSAARRLQLLDFAQRSGAWIIEDDYDSEYRYDSMPIASLQGLDRNARVIYIGSFSKVMFPSMRLGYMVLPADLVERFAAVRVTTDISPAHATQAVMAQFIREGHFARHIRRMRPLYAQRRRVLVAEIARQLPRFGTVMGDDAGMHLAFVLDRHRDDQKLAARAAEDGLLLSALSNLYLGSDQRTGFVLGFGNTKESEIAGGISRLKRILRIG